MLSESEYKSQPSTYKSEAPTHSKSGGWTKSLTDSDELMAVQSRLFTQMAIGTPNSMIGQVSGGANHAQA